MRKNIVIGILGFACFILLYLCSSLYSDIRDYKYEIGRQHYYLVNDTRYIVRVINETNIQGALQTEQGIQYLSFLSSQLWEKERLFFETPNRLHDIGVMLREIDEAMDMSVKRGSITEQEEASIKNKAEIIGFIMIDLEGFASRDVSWYDLFRDRELNEKINNKIDQRINEDY